MNFEAGVSTTSVYWLIFFFDTCNLLQSPSSFCVVFVYRAQSKKQTTYVQISFILRTGAQTLCDKEMFAFHYFRISMSDMFKKSNRIPILLPMKRHIHFGYHFDFYFLTILITADWRDLISDIYILNKMKTKLSISKIFPSFFTLINNFSRKKL